jgi:hypothetical protein
MTDEESEGFRTSRSRRSLDFYRREAMVTERPGVWVASSLRLILASRCRFGGSESRPFPMERGPIWTPKVPEKALFGQKTRFWAILGGVPGRGPGRPENLEKTRDFIQRDPSGPLFCTPQTPISPHKKKGSV